jgi:deazaflavin-dependent oxidoreductase (nitroreductase family)
MVRLNVAVLRRGLQLGSQSLLTVRGRTSGVDRATPVSLVTVDGDRYIVAAFADADWVKNVRAAGAGSLSRGRDRQAVELVELPEGGRGPILRAFLSQVRGGRRFFDSADPETVVAAADRYPVFRVDTRTDAPST